jgi:hypothetical protein
MSTTIGRRLMASAARISLSKGPWHIRTAVLSQGPSRTSLDPNHHGRFIPLTHWRVFPSSRPGSLNRLCDNLWLAYTYLYLAYIQQAVALFFDFWNDGVCH